MTMRLTKTRTIARLGLGKIFALLASLLMWAAPASAQNSDQYSFQEVVDAGHGFFGETTGGLAKVVERAFQQYGLPNGYILGQEGSGAFVAGLTYGEGTLYTKNAGQHPVFWQGPSLGLDYGGQGTRAMMLVYNLPSVDSALSPLRRRQRLGLHRRRRRHDLPEKQRCHAGTHSHRHRRAPRHQCRLPEAYPGTDLEPLLTLRWGGTLAAPHAIALAIPLPTVAIIA